MKILVQWLKTNRIILINAGSLVGTNMVTSMLGFVYWWVAARKFLPESVGIASASISAMTLLGSFCIVGLGTLLITELPRQPGREGTLISTALIVVGGIGGSVGIVFAVVASYVSPNFKSLGANILDVVIFASGVSFTAITLVLDQALIGLLLGKLQLWRNTLFAVTKLAALFAVSLLLSAGDGIAIYATWAIGNVISLIALAVLLMFKKRWPGRKYLPQWRVLRKLGPAAVQHHLLNITLQLPTSVLPVLVTVLLSAKINAWFYVSWTIVGFVFFVPVALTMVLHAMNSAQQSTLAHKARVTISLALVTSALAICLFQFAANWVLGIFGSSYAEQATWTLRVLVLAAFPLVIKNHYISVCRIRDRVKNAMLLIAPGSLIELCAAAMGGHLDGLTGLSVGWVIAVYIESIFMLPTIYKAVLPLKKSILFTELQYTEMPALWLVDTSPLPTINPNTIGKPAFEHTNTIPLPILSQNYITAETPWLIDTILLPAIRLPSKDQVSRERGRGNLRSSQLQRRISYTLYPGCTPITDPAVESRFFVRRNDDSTIIRDELI